MKDGLITKSYFRDRILHDSRYRVLPMKVVDSLLDDIDKAPVAFDIDEVCKDIMSAIAEGNKEIPKTTAVAIIKDGYTPPKEDIVNRADILDALENLGKDKGYSAAIMTDIRDTICQHPTSNCLSYLVHEIQNMVEVTCSECGDCSDCETCKADDLAAKIVSLINSKRGGAD